MGKKRKKNNISNNSGNHSKVQITSVSSFHDISSDCEIDKKFVNMQTPTHFVAQNQSTPQNNGNFQPYPVMNYSGSPIQVYPPNQPMVTPSQFETINYTEKIDQLSNKLDKVFNKLQKLDQIESKLLKFETTIGSVMNDVKTLKSKVDEMDEGVSFLNVKFEENTEQVNEMHNCVKNLVSENDDLKHELVNMKSEFNALSERNLELQSRSMRDNLIFTGIAEEEREDTETILNGFIKNTLEITQDIGFHRVHRMGRKINGHSRPIVAKFINFKDREVVRKAAPNALRKTENRNYGINEQFPKEINERRKKLYPYYKSAKRENKKANLVYDKLYIDGREFKVDGEMGGTQSSGITQDRRSQDRRTPGWRNGDRKQRERMETR